MSKRGRISLLAFIGCIRYNNNKIITAVLHVQRIDIMQDLKLLYSKPLQSSRSGVLYNTFPYPTKISPEAIAVYIACSTNPGDTVLDAFAGSGSTGMAALLCEHPTEQMLHATKRLGVRPVWGARNATLYEIGTYASFATKTLLNRLSERDYQTAVDRFISRASELVGAAYAAAGPDGQTGILRYAIWSELLSCPGCGGEVPYFDYAMSRDPAAFHKRIICPHCRQACQVDDMPFVTEDHWDTLLHRTIQRKKRVLSWIYGATGDKKWDRRATGEDMQSLQDFYARTPMEGPAKEIQWGDLHRAGYHYGITHLHHFYTDRNYIVMSKLWQLAGSFPDRQADALKLLLLSYNATHCTLMTRVVAKKNTHDFVLTGAQSGVLYISKAPVEKNILLGLQRKAKLFAKAYGLLEACTGTVTIHNTTSAHMAEPDNSVDFVFTDPPFGDFIPYAEVNQINELWLSRTTDRSMEVIISDSQHRDVFAYQEMLAQVFQEVYRVLKPTRYASVVFHAAKAAVWKAFKGAVNAANFQIVLTNILDKTQSSFKQVVSEGSVQCDPLFLLQKGAAAQCCSLNDRDILNQLIQKNTSDPSFNMRRCYSLYVNTCLELGAVISMDAKQVYDYFQAQRGSLA